MTITICGSMAFATEMQKIQEELKALGITAYIPQIEEQKTKSYYIKDHFEKIENSTAILVVNLVKHDTEGYVGANSLMEMGYAFSKNKTIFLYEAPSTTQSAYQEISGMNPVIINKDLTKINEQISDYPQAYLASTSGIKLSATELGFQALGKNIQLGGHGTLSGVSEQPMSWEECYIGAHNRLSDLKAKVTSPWEYLISVESGLHQVATNSGYFDVHVCVIENHLGEKRVGVASSVAYPQEMLDKVPSLYPDLGVLVQKEYGIDSKDPIIVITKGQIKRQQLVIDAVRNALAQF